MTDLRKILCHSALAAGFGLATSTASALPLEALRITQVIEASALSKTLTTNGPGGRTAYIPGNAELDEGNNANLLITGVDPEGSVIVDVSDDANPNAILVSLSPYNPTPSPSVDATFLSLVVDDFLFQVGSPQYVLVGIEIVTSNLLKRWDDGNGNFGDQVDIATQMNVDTNSSAGPNISLAGAALGVCPLLPPDTGGCILYRAEPGNMFSMTDGSASFRLTFREVPANAVPEPATFALLGLGLLGLGGLSRRRK